MFGYTIVKPRSSSCLEFAAVNLLQRKVIVRFKKSKDEYQYNNVSRRRLISLLNDKNKSLGFWIQYLRNNAIKPSNSKALKGKMTYELIGNSYEPKLIKNALPSKLSLV